MSLVYDSLRNFFTIHKPQNIHLSLYMHVHLTPRDHNLTQHICLLNLVIELGNLKIFKGINYACFTIVIMMCVVHLDVDLI